MRKLFFILIIGFATQGVNAQQSVLLQQYRQMALEYNHDLKSAEKNIVAGMELHRSAKADLKPKLSADANFQYTGNPMELTLGLPVLESPVSFTAQEARYGASLSLLQPIYTGGRLLERIRLMEHQTEYARGQKEMLQSAVCFQTDVQYWNTVARAELVAIADSFYYSVESLTEAIRQRVEVGTVDPQELLMAEVKLNEAHYQQLQAQNSFETGRMALNSLIGRELSLPTEVERKLPAQVLETLPAPIATVSQRPEIRMAQAQVQMEKSRLRLNDAQYLPQLSVGLEGSYSSPGYNFRSDLDPNYALYAKLSVPLFEWGKRRSDKRAYSQQVGMATDQLNKVNDAVDLEVETARLNFVQASERSMLTNSSLSKADENERKALERYTEGKASIVEVLDAQVYKQTAQINHVQAKLATQSSYAELLRVLHLNVYLCPLSKESSYEK